MSKTYQDKLFPNMIPGWPNPTKHNIKVFQENNRCSVDGIIGPETRSAIWRPVGNEYRAVVLAPYVYGYGAIPTEERAFLGCYLSHSDDPNVKNLLPVHWQKLFEIVSSNWSTNLSWLTGEDGLTIGFRRYAASKARSILCSYFRSYSLTPLNFYILHRINQIQDAPNNGWPICDPAMRATFLDLANQQSWWAKQIQVALKDWTEILERYPEWTSGEMIALACRAQNSSPGYVKNLPQDEDRAWSRLVDKYTDGGRKKNRLDRIDRIREAIPRNETWR